jgi:hypothetical protein
MGAFAMLFYVIISSEEKSMSYYDNRILLSNISNTQHMQQGATSQATGHHIPKSNNQPTKSWWPQFSKWNWWAKAAAIVSLILGAALAGALAFLAWKIIVLAVIASVVTAGIWLVTMHRPVYDWMAKWGTRLDNDDLPLDLIEEQLETLLELSKKFNEELNGFYQEPASEFEYLNAVKNLNEKLKQKNQGTRDKLQIPERKEFMQRIERKLNIDFAAKLNAALVSKDSFNAVKAEHYFPELSRRIQDLTVLHDKLIKTKALADNILAKVDVNDAYNQERKDNAARAFESYACKIADYSKNIRELTKIKDKIYTACNNLLVQVSKLFYGKVKEQQSEVKQDEIPVSQTIQPLQAADEPLISNLIEPLVMIPCMDKALAPSPQHSSISAQVGQDIKVAVDNHEEQNTDRSLASEGKTSYYEAFFNSIPTLNQNEHQDRPASYEIPASYENSNMIPS